MIVLFTDFGPTGPYVGQMHMVLHRLAPGIEVVDLMNDAPAFNPKAASYLLGAYRTELKAGDVLLGVVDPGVGSERLPLIVQCDGVWCIGPDNGLFSRLIADAKQAVKAWRIDWRPKALSASFHGRDLFAPVAARLAMGLQPAGTTVKPTSLVGTRWPSELREVIYIDPYGNVMTGIRAAAVSDESVIRLCGKDLKRSETFSSVLPGSGFWYENANGLLEISVNCGRADQVFDLQVGTQIQILNT